MKIKEPIEKRAKPYWTVCTALEEMLEHRNWEENTYKAYLKDAESFEDFSIQEGFEPTLQNTSLHHVDKWIKICYEDKVAYKTLQRKKASLASIFTFYQTIGTIKSNPFKAADLPVGKVGHHSRALELTEIIDVYEAVHNLKTEEGIDVGVTMGVLINTGLRGHSLAKIKVEDVWIDKEIIYYDAGVVNSKHIIQFFPIPPRLLEEIKNHITYYDLQPGDQLLHGLKGLPLRAKQINRLTNRINKVLGWEKEQHVTPHGYRASIATILDERGMDIDNIKYLLGHAISRDNIHYYLRRDQRKIRALRSELTAIEKEIYEELEKRKMERMENHSAPVLTLEHQELPMQEQTHSNEQISMEAFLNIMKKNPLLAQKIAEKNLVKL